MTILIATSTATPNAFQLEMKSRLENYRFDVELRYYADPEANPADLQAMIVPPGIGAANYASTGHYLYNFGVPSMFANIWMYEAAKLCLPGRTIWTYSSSAWLARNEIVGTLDGTTPLMWSDGNVNRGFDNAFNLIGSSSSQGNRYTITRPVGRSDRTSGVAIERNARLADNIVAQHRHVGYHLAQLSSWVPTEANWAAFMQAMFWLVKAQETPVYGGQPGETIVVGGVGGLRWVGSDGTAIAQVQDEALDITTVHGHGNVLYAGSNSIPTSGTDGRRLRAYVDGVQQWESQTYKDSGYVASIIADESGVYAGAEGYNEPAAVFKHTHGGAPLWKNELSTSPAVYAYTSMAFYQGDLLADNSDILITIDRATGARKLGLYLDGFSAYWTLAEHPNGVIVTSFGNNVRLIQMAIDPDGWAGDGGHFEGQVTTVWDADVGGPATSAVVLDNGDVLAMSPGKFVRINGATGVIIWARGNPQGTLDASGVNSRLHRTRSGRIFSLMAQYEQFPIGAPDYFHSNSRSWIWEYNEEGETIGGPHATTLYAWSITSLGALQIEERIDGRPRSRMLEFE